MTKTDDVTREMHRSRIKRDNRDFQSIIRFMENCINPFETDTADLVNISTARKASEETSHFLLNWMSIGEKMRDHFIENCSNDPESFDKPIPRQKLHTFASQGVRVQKKRADGKLKELRMERDLFGRILVIALEKTVDIRQVLEYPLTPVPLCLFHADGDMNKTNKAKLFKVLEDRVPSHNPPETIDAIIVDGFYHLHTYPDLPASMGKTARHILQRICAMKAKTIYLVFDRVASPSIKDMERDKRTDSDREIPSEIGGDHQLRPTDFLKALRNDNFKRLFVSFLLKNWSDDSINCFLGDKTLYVTEGFACFSFRALNGRVLVREEENMRSIHEEADSRMISHLKYIPTPSNVVIRTTDTDVLAIAIGNLSKIEPGIHVWLEVGSYNKNNHRFIDVNSICEHLGESLSNAIPAIHAFTGCDYLPAFSRKAKTRPLSILEKNKEFQIAFASLGTSETIQEDTVKIIEQFVCTMYGNKNLESVNACRYQMFMKIYKPKNKNPLSSVKGIDGSSLPPCKSVLMEQIKRTNSVCSIWRNAIEFNPKIIPPNGNGWNLIGGKYSPTWFEGDMAPSTLEEILLDSTTETLDDVDDELPSVSDESDSSSSDEE